MKKNLAAAAHCRPQNRPESASIAGLRRVSRGLLAGLGVLALPFVASPALAQVAPNLGAASSYAVLGTNLAPTTGTVTCTDTGPGIAINGNVGTSGSAITNTNCTINGTVTAPVPAQVRSDLVAAYGALDTDNACGTLPIPTTSATLLPGVYCSTAATTIGTGVIFTLNGSATDVWVFKVGTGGGGALTTTGLQMVMGGGARACNVYWRTAEAATVGNSAFKGTVISGTAFTLTGGSFDGRALALTDATITDPASLNFAGCDPAPVINPGDETITVSKDFSPDSSATVPVSLVCTNGVVPAVSTLNPSEGSPAVFVLPNPPVGTTCTATETVPGGYVADQSACVNVPLGGSCTISNVLMGASPTSIPTLGQWALILLSSLLAAAGMWAYRKQTVKA